MSRDHSLEKLADLRASIDNIDAALINMLAERFRRTKEVGVLKAQHGMPPADPARERTRILTPILRRSF
jgi:chorismate mutase